MKTFLLILTTAFLSIPLTAQTIKPGVRTTFHAVDEKGKPINEENIEVEVTFAKADAQGNKVPVYSEKFSAKTTKDGYFQRVIGATKGDLPTVTFGAYKDVDFKDSTLCIRVDFRRKDIFNAPWIVGNFNMMNPVPVATETISNDDQDKDPANEIQDIKKNGKYIYLTGTASGSGIDLEDDDPKNELQKLNFDPLTKTLYLSDGNQVDLSTLLQFTKVGNTLSTEKEVKAGHFTTTNGFTDIEEGKISFRYNNGQDGIEMGVDDEFCAPFINFMDCEGNSLGAFRMGAQGFKFYPN